MTDTIDAPASSRSGPTTPDDAPTPRWKQTLGRVAIVLAASSTLVWIGAIIWGAAADPKPVGYLEDRSFPGAAEPICEQAVADIDEYPPAHESPTPEARADVIRATTARLDTMLDDLRAVVPDTADAKWINLWIDDWNTHLGDRLDFATRLDERGAGEEFFESLKADTQISKSLSHFAEINDMPSCATTGDV